MTRPAAAAGLTSWLNWDNPQLAAAVDDYTCMPRLFCLDVPRTPPRQDSYERQQLQVLRGQQHGLQLRDGCLSDALARDYVHLAVCTCVLGAGVRSGGEGRKAGQLRLHALSCVFPPRRNAHMHMYLRAPARNKRGPAFVTARFHPPLQAMDWTGLPHLTMRWG
jgi:hypothetical protein